MTEWILLSKKITAKELRKICSKKEIVTVLQVVKKQVKKEKTAE